MAEISVTRAAQIVGKPRKSLYRLMDSGKLSFTIDAQGKRVIDEAELYRVFPDSCRYESGVTPVTKSVNGHDEAVSALSRQLEAALEREKWLRTRLEEVERERSALAQRLLPPAPENAESLNTRKSWWRRIFG